MIKTERNEANSIGLNWDFERQSSELTIDLINLRGWYRTSWSRWRRVRVFLLWVFFVARGIRRWATCIAWAILGFCYCIFSLRRNNCEIVCLERDLIASILIIRFYHECIVSRQEIPNSSIDFNSIETIVPCVWDRVWCILGYRVSKSDV